LKKYPKKIRNLFSYLQERKSRSQLKLKKASKAIQAEIDKQTCDAIMLGFIHVGMAQIMQIKV
jgi:hypothetical protein